MSAGDCDLKPANGSPPTTQNGFGGFEADLGDFTSTHESTSFTESTTDFGSDLQFSTSDVVKQSVDTEHRAESSSAVAAAAADLADEDFGDFANFAISSTSEPEPAEKPSIVQFPTADPSSSTFSSPLPNQAAGEDAFGNFAAFAPHSSSSVAFVGQHTTVPNPVDKDSESRGFPLSPSRTTAPPSSSFEDDDFGDFADFSRASPSSSDSVAKNSFGNFPAPAAAFPAPQPIQPAFVAEPAYPPPVDPLEAVKTGYVQSAFRSAFPDLVTPSPLTSIGSGGQTLQDIVFSNQANSGSRPSCKKCGATVTDITVVCVLCGNLVAQAAELEAERSALEGRLLLALGGSKMTRRNSGLAEVLNSIRLDDKMATYAAVFQEDMANSASPKFTSVLKNMFFKGSAQQQRPSDAEGSARDHSRVEGPSSLLDMSRMRSFAGPLGAGGSVRRSGGLSADAKTFIKDIPDLSFMLSPVLVVPTP